jgi:hypothetical protein
VVYDIQTDFNAGWNVFFNCSPYKFISPKKNDRKSILMLKTFCKTVLFGCCVTLMSLLLGCTAPQRFWPQKDIIGSETAVMNGKEVVLIASRNSDFKKQLVDKIHDQLVLEGFSQKTIGIKSLQEIEASDYAAVVVISTCLAWGLDYDVQAFLERQKRYKNIILVTTSGDGVWLPEKGSRDFDAISAASEMTSLDSVTRNVMVRIRLLPKFR